MLINSEINITDKANNNDQTEDFLSSGIPSPKDRIESIENEQVRMLNNLITDEVLHDIKHLNATELKNKYPSTYNSWKNMKSRRHIGRIIHPDFDKFKDFLRHLGPCENPKYTLDRINNDDPEYAPDKVAWRDNYAQNSNKGNNIFLTHDDGRTLTIAQWAKTTNQKPATLYKRHNNGWSDMEIITGKRTNHVSPVYNNPWPYKYKDEWEKRYLDAIVNGCEMSKIAFLRKKSLTIQDDSQTRINKFKLAVAYKEANTEFEAIPKLHKGYLEYVGYDIENFKNTLLRTLKNQLQQFKDMMSRCDTIIKETGEQILYQERRKEFLRYSGGGNSKNQLLNRFKELYPEPVYTVNKPPVNSLLSECS